MWPVGTGRAVLLAKHSQAGRLELWLTGRELSRSAAQLEAPEALAAWQAEGHWASKKQSQGTLSLSLGKASDMTCN